MTIAIAAICDNTLQPKIVLCSDTKGSSHLGTTDRANKEVYLRDCWFCLGAGIEEECKAISAIFRRLLVSREDLDETNIVQLVRSGLQERKLEKADELMLGRWGMSFAEFRQAKDQFPAEIFAASVEDVARISLGADFIVAGFLQDGQPMLIETNADSVAKIREGYAIVGEGTYLAQSGLMHRDHTDDRSLARTLYCVLEAKIYAQRISTVGTGTVITIVHPDSEPQTVTDAADKHLGELFERFGPKELIEDEFPREVPKEFLKSPYVWNIAPFKAE